MGILLQEISQCLVKRALILSEGLIQLIPHTLTVFQITVGNLSPYSGLAFPSFQVYYKIMESLNILIWKGPIRIIKTQLLALHKALQQSHHVPEHVIPCQML